MEPNFDFKPQPIRPETPEVQELAEKFEQLVSDCLDLASKKLNELGEIGKEPVGENRYKEISLRADREIEGVIIEHLKKQNLPILLISEEHGEVNLGSGEPQYVAFLDGLDGSGSYKNGKGRYCTMPGLFKGSNPRFGDYIAAGVIDHKENTTYVARKGVGAWAKNAQGKTSLHASEAKTVDHRSKINANTNFESIKQIQDLLPGFSFANQGSSGINYMEVANGSAEANLEVSFKANLELAVAYGLVKEAGGVVMNRLGKDIGQIDYKEFPDPEKKGIPVDFSLLTKREVVFVLANPDLAKETLQLIQTIEKKRRNFFAGFLLAHKKELAVPMKMHKEFGLRKNQVNKKEDWSNVSRHCVTEMVAADILAEKLGLSAEDRLILIQACFLHDSYKRKSMEMIRAAKDKTQADIDSQKNARAELIKYGIDQKVIDVLDKSLGYDSLDYVLKGSPTIVEQVMHYVDDVTAGEQLTTLKIRTDKLKANPDYKKIHEDGHAKWGMGTYDMQFKAGEAVEKKLAEKLGLSDHTKLSEFINQEIITRINAVEL